MSDDLNVDEFTEGVRRASDKLFLIDEVFAPDHSIAALMLAHQQRSVELAAWLSVCNDIPVKKARKGYLAAMQEMTHMFDELVAEFKEDRNQNGI